MALSQGDIDRLRLLELEDEELALDEEELGLAPEVLDIPDRSNEPFEIEFAQHGGEVGPPVFRTEDEKRLLREKAPTHIPALVGGTVGAFAGAGVLSVPLAALGAAAGEAFDQLWRRTQRDLFGDETVGSIPGTSGEAAKNIGIEAALAGGGEGVGRVAVKGGAAVLSKLRPELKPGVQKAVAAIEGALPEGATPMLPANATESTLIDAAQGISESSIFGGNRIVRAKQMIDETTTGLIDDFTRELTGGVDDFFAGELIQDAVSGGKRAFSATGSGLYKALDRASGAKFNIATKPFKRVSDTLVDAAGKPQVIEGLERVEELANGVNLKPIKAEARKLLETAEKSIKGDLQENVLKQVLGKADNVPFEDAHLIRSQLLAIRRDGASEVVKGEGARVGAVLADAIDGAMETAAKNMEGDALIKWRTADNFWREGKATFNNALIKKIANQSPEAGLAAVINSGKLENLRLLEDVMFSPNLSPEVLAKNTETWRVMQGKFLERLKGTAVSDQVEKTLRGSTLLNKLSKIRPEDWRRLNPTGNLEPYKDFVQALALNQAKQPGSKADVVIKLIQAGALTTMIFKGETDGASMSILFGPLAMSMAVTNPALSRLIINGMKGKGTKEQLTRLASRIMAQAQRDKIDLSVELEGKEVPPPEVSEQRESPLITITPEEFSVDQRPGLNRTRRAQP